MSKIQWDAVGERFYEVGVDRGVFYSDGGGVFVTGVPWNGLISVEPAMEGHAVSPLKSADVNVDAGFTPDDQGGTITAYTYPDEFEDCLGTQEIIPGLSTRQQEYSRFGLSYRTLVGNDIEGNQYGYKIHLIYNAQITEITNPASTISNPLTPTNFTWKYTTFPMTSEYSQPYSELIIDSTKVSAELLAAIEDILYGSDYDSARMPLLEELYDLYYSYGADGSDSVSSYPYAEIFPSESIYPVNL